VIFRDEKLAFKEMKLELERTLTELGRAKTAQATAHVRVTTELENRYEHKIADQMSREPFSNPVLCEIFTTLSNRRYDTLVEEMETLKQNCEATLLSERRAFEKKLDSLRVEAQLKEKKLKTENRRIAEDRVNDTNYFKEILDQQENEYEKELKDLIHSAESELTSERDTITKLRTLVQTKITKVDQLKKKLVEVSLI
jgi:organic radical activating enzyme